MSKITNEFKLNAVILTAVLALSQILMYLFAEFTAGVQAWVTAPCFVLWLLAMLYNYEAYQMAKNKSEYVGKLEEFNERLCKELERVRRRI